MSNTLTGKVHKILKMESGTGAKGNWVKQEFVIETDADHPKTVCFSVWGDKTEALKKLNPGDKVNVSFNLESREYNGKWYADIRAWKIEPGEAKKTFSEPKVSTEKVNEVIEEDDTLPF